MKKQIIIIILSIGILVAGMFAFGNKQAFAAAQCPSEGLEGMRFLFFHGPLVPCGIEKKCAGNNENVSINKPCTICHFIVLIQNIFNLLLSLLILVSIFMLTVAGVLYIVSAGGKMMTMAKEILHKTLLGFGLFLLSWLIVFTVLSLLSANTSMIGKGDDGLFQFTCDDESYFYINPNPDSDNPSTDPDNPSTDPGNPNTNPGERTYDPGIESQESDASDPLKELMECMDERIPAQANRVSSISDSAGMDRCVNNWSRPPCAHEENSCHYGGQNCSGQSYAVDYGNETYASQIISAAGACGASWINEGSHIHVSIGTQNNCNCGS